MINKLKTLRLKGTKYKSFRKSVFEKSLGRCYGCGAWAPLYDQDGQFDVFSCGHVSHKKSRGSGGGDTIDNAEWMCYRCHMKIHGPKWSNNY